MKDSVRIVVNIDVNREDLDLFISQLDEREEFDQDPESYCDQNLEDILAECESIIDVVDVDY